MRGDILEHGIALGMAMLVVERLEIVEVDHQHRSRLPLTLGEREEAVERVFHIAAVVQARHRVAQRLGPQLFAQRDVGQRERSRIGQRPRDPAGFLHIGALAATIAQHQQAENLPARHHRHFDTRDLTDIVGTAQRLFLRIVEMVLAALQRPAVGGHQTVRGDIGLGHVPAVDQVEPVARIVEHIEGDAAAWQQLAAGGAQHLRSVRIAVRALQRVGHREELFDLFLRLVDAGEARLVLRRLRFPDPMDDEAEGEGQKQMPSPKDLQHGDPRS